jgi:hypothetical protein
MFAGDTAIFAHLAANHKSFFLTGDERNRMLRL